MGAERYHPAQGVLVAVVGILEAIGNLEAEGLVVAYLVVAEGTDHQHQAEGEAEDRLFSSFLLGPQNLVDYSDPIVVEEVRLHLDLAD
jgi:hypothetical protein